MGARTIDVERATTEKDTETRQAFHARGQGGGVNLVLLTLALTLTALSATFITLYVTKETSSSSSSSTTTELTTSFYNRESMEYPPATKFVVPSDFWLGFVVPVLHASTVQEYETPIAVYQTMRLDQIMWNCIAAYHATAMDATSPITGMTRPSATVATVAYHTSQMRVLCSAHAINGLLVAGLNINAVAPFQKRMDMAGLDTTVPTADEMTTASASVSPYWIGHRLAAAMITKMKMDGTNFDGAKDRWGETCPESKRCFKYGDDGSLPRFAPTNDPWAQTSTDSLGWKPQLESNMLGFVQANGHIVPHIGNMATFLVDKATHKATYGIQDNGANPPVPNSYAGADMTAMLNTTMQAVAAAAQDVPAGKDTVDFMDNKINLAGGMMMRMRERFLMSFEEQVYYHVGYTTAEMDSVILAWEAKIKYNRARPTQLVNDGNHGYSGDTLSWNGIEYGMIANSQWDAMIRVMPHAEYPSGSGCICTVVAHYVDRYVQLEHGLAAFKTHWNVGSGTPLTYQTMTELRDACGSSRVSGGMHFQPAVDDSYTLCDAIGTQAFDGYVQKLLGMTSSDKFDNAFPSAVPYPAPSVNMFTIPA